MKIVENWRKLWRSTTVLLSALLAILSAAQAVLPTVQAAVDAKTFAQVSLALAVLIGALRYVSQSVLHTDEDPPAAE